MPLYSPPSAGGGGGGDVTTDTAQTITGLKTMSAANIITHAPTGLKVQDSDASHAVTIAPSNESADRTLNIPVLGATDIMMTEGVAQTVAGKKSFTGGVVIDTGTKTATASAGAATLNKLSGKITTESLSTAAQAGYTLTLTNSVIAAGDIVLANVANGTNTTGTPNVTRVLPGAGSAVIVVHNIHASAAFNGTLVVSFVVLKAS